MRRAALRLFSERGIDDTSVKDIVRAARTTQPMVYYYYGSKNYLCIELFREISGEILAGAARIMGRSRPLNVKLEALFNYYSGYFRRNPGIARFLLHSTLSMRHGKAIRAVGNEAQGAARKALLRMMEEHVSAGELDPGRVEAAAELANAVILYLILGKHSRPGLPGGKVADIICGWSGQ